MRRAMAGLVAVLALAALAAPAPLPPEGEAARRLAQADPTWDLRAVRPKWETAAVPTVRPGEGEGPSIRWMASNEGAVWWLSPDGRYYIWWGGSAEGPTFSRSRRGRMAAQTPGRFARRPGAFFSHRLP